jgi:thymidylate kinase
MKNKLKVITFSGVDGAGKSSVIQIIKTELESMGYDVIELRSRPQILPILSSFKYGKINAEESATNTMPRTGSNDSLISSLFRFMYYFSDYIFGQFYLSYKYQKDSTIIIYDRYYFDYIIDPKRANIVLSETLIKFLYKLIFKPDLNIFLFAPANHILRRKNELDEETINNLTLKYKNLFNELNKNNVEDYIAVENISLEYCTSDIINLVNKKL